MTEQTLPNDEPDANANPDRDRKLLFPVILGAGAIATFGWVTLLGWGMIHLIGSLVG